MTPDLISALVDLGSAGAVIAVVVIFLRTIKERDAEWRSFFMILNQASVEDASANRQTMQHIIESLEHLVEMQTEHERREAQRHARTKPVRQKVS